MAGHIATASNTNWTTEQRVVDLIREVFPDLALDPCSNEQSTVHARVNFCLPEHNGLTESWAGYESIYVNPPFGRSYIHAPCQALCISRQMKRGQKTKTEYVCMRCETVLARKAVEGSSIADWVEKMILAHMYHGADVIGLLPAAVGTAHFQEYVWATATAVCFPYGRLTFSGRPSESKKGDVAPMDVCLPYWGSEPMLFEQVFTKLGFVNRLDIARKDYGPTWFGVDWAVKSADMCAGMP